MPKFPMSPIIIKHRGFYDNEKTIQNIFGWFKNNNFFFDLKKFKLTGITTKFTFEGDKKVTEYIKWHMKCFIIVYDLEDVEIIKEGEKIKTNHGKFHCEITSELELDWQKRYQNHGKFITFLGDFLRKYILRYKISDMWEDELCLKMDELARVIKKTLGSEVV